MKPLVSVILPVFNDEARVGRCVQSLLDQSYNKIEYIIVDDGCTDDSYEVICRVIDSYPNRKNNCIILRHAQNRGSYAARLTGLSAATGVYIIQVDSDDYASPNFIEHLVQTALRDDADIVICDYVAIKSNYVEHVAIASPQSPEQLMCNIITGDIHAGLWNKLMRMDLISSFDLRPGIVRSMYDDKVISMQAAYFSKRISFVGEPLYEYTVRNSNSITDSEKYNIGPDNAFVHFAEEFFAHVPVTDAMILALNKYGMGIRGKALLYGNKEELAFSYKYVETSNLSTIFSLSTIPIHYKIALACEHLGMPHVLNAIRWCIGRFLIRHDIQ